MIHLRRTVGRPRLENLEGSFATRAREHLSHRVKIMGIETVDIGILSSVPPLAPFVVSGQRLARRPRASRAETIELSDRRV